MSFYLFIGLFFPNRQ